MPRFLRHTYGLTFDDEMVPTIFEPDRERWLAEIEEHLAEREGALADFRAEVADFRAKEARLLAAYRQEDHQAHWDGTSFLRHSPACRALGELGLNLGRFIQHHHPKMQCKAERFGPRHALMLLAILGLFVAMMALLISANR